MVQACGADSGSSSPYIASKGRGEEAIRQAFPGAIVLRPSVVFGPEDDFLNRFAASGALSSRAAAVWRRGPSKCSRSMSAMSPKRPWAPSTEARSAGRDLRTWRARGDESTRNRRIHPAARPARHRALTACPSASPSFWRREPKSLSALSLGIFPKALVTTRDQIELLRHDNLVFSPDAVAAGRTRAGARGNPAGVEANRARLSLPVPQDPANMPTPARRKFARQRARRIDPRQPLIQPSSSKPSQKAACRD